MNRLLTVLLAVLMSLPGLAACGKDKAEAQSAPERLAAAKKSFDAADGVRIALSTEPGKFPTGINGILTATGVGVREPAGFKGEIKVLAGGVSATVPVVALDGKVWVDFGGWRIINPADFGAPDPATLLGNAGGLSALMTQVDGLKAGEDTRRGKKVFSTLSGTIAGKQVQGVIPQAADKPFKAKFLLDQDNVLQQVVLTGEFYPGKDDVTYDIEFSDYGATETITAPKKG